MADLRYPTQVQGAPAQGAAATPQVVNDGAAWGFTVLALCMLTMQTPINGMMRGSVVVIFMLCGLALLRMAPLRSVMASWRWLPTMGVPLLGILSMIWSDAPDESLRIGVMTLLTLCIAVIMADRLSPTRFLTAVYWALMLVVISSLAVYNPAFPLGGFTGSKNIMGYYATVGALASLAVALDPVHPRPLRMFAVVTTPLCLLALKLSQSAGSFVVGMAALGVFLFLAVMRRLTAQGRMRALIAVFILATPMIIARPALVEAAHTFQERVLKKDRTLTGRTYLWDRARPIIESRPILGHGYAAFWRQGTLEAEGLWRWGHITDRAGFNFHSDYVDIAVALGRLGVVVFILTMLMIGVPLVVRAILAPTLPLAFFTAFVVSAFLKTPAESGMILAWTFPTVLLWGAAVYGRRGDGRPLLAPPEPMARPAMTSTSLLKPDAR